MGIFHKKDGQRPAQKGQKCDFGEKSAYIGRRLGAKIGVSQKKRNRRFLCYETSEIRLSVTDHTFTLSEKVPHQEAVTLALKERQNCLEEMERRGVAHQVDRSYQLEDGTPVLEVRKQYNNYPAGDYLK